MSPWTILLLSKLDAIMTTAGIILTCHLVIFGVIGIGGILADEKHIIAFFKNNIKKLIIPPIVCIIILLTVPSRDTALLMWVLPKISQSQLVQKDFPEMYEKAMKILNEEIEKKLNGDKK
jgi:uncharacterized protein YqgQ